MTIIFRCVILLFLVIPAWAKNVVPKKCQNPFMSQKDMLICIDKIPLLGKKHISNRQLQLTLTREDFNKIYVPVKSNKLFVEEFDTEMLYSPYYEFNLQMPAKPKPGSIVFTPLPLFDPKEIDIDDTDAFIKTVTKPQWNLFNLFRIDFF